MSPEQQKALDEIHEELHQRRRRMTPDESRAFLQSVGILDRQGRLAAQYGGLGDATPPTTSWQAEDPLPTSEISRSR